MKLTAHVTCEKKGCKKPKSQAPRLDAVFLVRIETSKKLLLQTHSQVVLGRSLTCHYFRCFLKACEWSAKNSRRLHVPLRSGYQVILKLRHNLCVQLT